MCILLGYFGLRPPSVQFYAAPWFTRGLLDSSVEITPIYTIFSVLWIRNSHHGSLNLSHPFFRWLKLHPWYLGTLQCCDTEVSHRLPFRDRLVKDQGHLYHTHSLITSPLCPNPVIPTGMSPPWEVLHPPAQAGGDLPRPPFTSQRPEPRRRPFVQAVLESLVCPQEGSGRKAASQPPN